METKLSYQTKASWTLRASGIPDRASATYISALPLFTDPTIDHLLQTPIHQTGEERMARPSSLFRSLGGLATLLALLGLGGVRGAYRRPKNKMRSGPLLQNHTSIYTCIHVYMHICRPDHPINQPIDQSIPFVLPPQPPQNHAQPTSSTASCPTIRRPRTRWACGTTRR